jgi:tetratricopeptide (TPR) repeat protein
LNAQRLLADALVRLDDVSTAQTLARDGLAEARLRGLQGVQGRFLNALTVIASHRQDLVEMLEAGRQSTELRRALGDRRNEAIGLCSTGSGWLDMGELAKARRDLEAALQLHTAIGDRGLEPIALANLSQLRLWEGDLEGALESAQAAHDIAVSVQAAGMQVLALWALGNAQLAADRPADALATFERAGERAGKMPLRHDAAAGRARVALAMGEVGMAVDCIEPVLEQLASDSRLDGTLGPRLVQLSCFQALRAAGDPRAAGVLARAYEGLQERAATISDASLRRSLLDNVPENRDIVAAWSAEQAAGPTTA